MVWFGADRTSVNEFMDDVEALVDRRLRWRSLVLRSRVYT